ncbi:unnamed protein product [Mytilus edulis]|uniref:Uncharacterized protein n=1 Tax=Mytilus edulis TaxID=6550 RepID=A0A8S3SRI5_MYTED|nr:unnamed protein product [Mytilus edulis]
MKNCNKDPVKLKLSLLNIVEHYKNNHEHCSELSRCKTDSNYEPTKYLIKDPKAEILLGRALMNTQVYKSPTDYVHCMDSYYVESFNNAILQYHDKRINFSKQVYILRTNLAVLDWNEHVNRQTTSLKTVQDAKNPRRQCFRCLVCDPGRLNLQSIPVSEYNKLTNTGELSDTILKELFKKEPALAGLGNFLPNVMEKFDIIVKPKLNNSNNREYQKSETYYLPCMITNAFDLECIIEENFKVQSSHRTPWLVLEFEFLPVVYFNHILFNYIRTYTVCKEASGHPAIHSGKAVVYLDNSESRLLIICFSRMPYPYRYAVKRKLIYNDANDKAYKLILEKLCVNIEELERKLMHSLSYKIKAKCGTGDNFKSEGRISFNELSREYEEHPGQYRCKEHKIWHDKEDMETTWLKHAPAVSIDNSRYCDNTL